MSALTRRKLMARLQRWIPMKRQQRKFIVEVKSARRRTTTNPSSIWGDTDLKALVRQAETEAPQLFEPAQRPDEPSPGQSAEVCPNESAGTDAVELTSDPAAPTEENIRAEDVSGPAFLSPMEANRTKTIPPENKPKRQGPTRRGRPLGSRTTTAAPEVLYDELAVLEVENRRLKGLLAQRLQQENVQLRKMLERFGTN
ncbi:hypothetical protein [Sinorhizobium sp. NFACC03]|uniref:hypothetical protein n=1 Tax=Sinorhizobium sp. NFACC03 TaxID=1566295 RepID=UPI0011600AB2|nr:hypothetical protein [Sinorhizobium sp. NFACC03]